MADIFLSYASEDRDTARALAAALERHGWTVWWDRTILAGKRFDKVIDQALSDARCVVVMWSATSVEKDWVIEEADEGKERDILVPVFVEPVTPPRGFRRIQAEDLSDWDGSDRLDAFPQFVSALEDKVGPVTDGGPQPRDGIEESNIPPKKPPPKKKTTKNRRATKKQPDRRQRPQNGAPAPLSTFRDTLHDGSQGPEMVVIPPGSFLMGSPKGESDSQENEYPQHPVTFRKSFSIGKHAVTWSEYAQYCASAGMEPPWHDESMISYRPVEVTPVVGVSWNDAREYCEWLSLQTSRSYRLPSEAEWEYAARARTTTRYWWGDDVGKNRANCKGCGGKWGGKAIAPVDSFAPNPFGLYSMLGNVCEWVEDGWHDDYTGAPEDGSAWILEDNDESWQRVMRGGSWETEPQRARCSARDDGEDGDSYTFVGFRLARDI